MAIAYVHSVSFLLRFAFVVFQGEEAWYSIDSEQLEALPVHVQLLKSRLNAFVKAQ